MRISNLLSYVSESIHAGWKKVYYWRNHKVTRHASVNGRYSQSGYNLFSSKTLDTWAIRTHPVDGSDLMVLRGKRLNQNRLQALKNSLIDHYQDFYTSQRELERKVDFVLAGTGLARMVGNELKPSRWFHARLNSKTLSRLDQYLSCNEPIHFGLLWLEKHNKVTDAFTTHCLVPALNDHREARFSHEELEAAGFLTSDKSGSFCLAQGPFSRTELKQLDYLSGLPPLITPEAEITIHTQHPELKEEKSADTAATKARHYLEHRKQSYQEGVALLADIESFPPPSVLRTAILKLADSTTTSESALIFKALAEDIDQEQLSEGRLNHYLLALMVAMPDNLCDLALLSQCCLNLNQPIKALQQDKWMADFHTMVEQLEPSICRYNKSPKYEMRHRYPERLPQYLAEYRAKHDEPDGKICLTRMYHLAASLEEAADAHRPASRSSRHLSRRARSWLKVKEAEFAIHLPEALGFELTEAPLSPEKLGVKELMAKDWEETLKQLNDCEDSREQFEKDRTRTDYILINNVTHLLQNSQRYDHNKRPLQESDLARYLGNRQIAQTLSQMLCQTLAAYSMKLEHKRLERVTPFTLQPMGKDPKDNNYITIRKMPDGNLLVEYTLDASKPVYQIGLKGGGVLGLEQYQIKSSTVVSMAALNRGLISASEPSVTVEAQLPAKGLEWFTSTLEPVPCPFLPEKENLSDHE